MQFIISTTDEILIPQAGLGLVGALLQDSKLRQRIDALDVEGFRRPEVKHGDVGIKVNWLHMQLSGGQRPSGKIL